MYSLEKRDPSRNRYSIKHKTNMGQPHSNRRPRESKADSPAKCQPGPSAPVGSAGHAHPGRLRWKCPLMPSPACREQVHPEGRWQRGMCVSGKEKRDARDVLFNSRHLSAATYSHSLDLVSEQVTVLTEPTRSEETLPVLSPGLNTINKS